MKALVEHNELASRMSKALLPGWGVEVDNVSEFLTAVELEVFVDPREDLIDLYARLRQVEACFKKATPSDGSVPDELVAMAKAKHLDIEAINRQTNGKFFAGNKHNRAKYTIETILPPLEHIWEEMWELCDYGPGAVFSGGGTTGKHVVSKIGGKHTCTRAAAGLYYDVVRSFFPNLANRRVEEDTLEIVRGNKLAFVPKDRTKCRTIAVEPSCNVFLQKGIGEWMARRLRQFGLDLRDQNPNVEAAWAGSITGDLATIDLSDASSRISRNVVRSLLPPDWFALLDVVRSPSWVDDNGKWHAYEMFSSQGNAFTFPLETLIFYALAKSSYSVGQSPIVYGDDIIVPSEYYAPVVETLEEYGFAVNNDKSFATGFFRESCGGDFLDGKAVRPIYYKKPAVRYSEVATLHNLLWEKWGSEIGEVLVWLRSIVPATKRIEGPVFTVASDKTFERNRLSRNDGWFMIEGFSPRSRWDSHIQTFVYTQKFWAVRGKEQSWSDSLQTACYLAFLRGGSSSVERSLDSVYYVGKKVLPVHSLRAESSLTWE